MISCSIGEPLSSNALQGTISARRIINSKFDAVRISEIKFSKIAVQMFLTAMLINALHAALEDAVVAFNRVGVTEPRTYSSALWLTLSWLAKWSPSVK